MQLSGHAGKGGTADKAERLIAGHAAVSVDAGQVDAVTLAETEIGDRVPAGRRVA